MRDHRHHGAARTVLTPLKTILCTLRRGAAETKVVWLKIATSALVDLSGVTNLFQNILLRMRK